MKDERLKMKGKRIHSYLLGCFILSIFIFHSLPSLAWNYNSTGATTENTVQMRVGADFSKKWDCGVKIGLSEDLRFNLYDVVAGTTAKNQSADANNGASFNRSHTTLSFSYAHPQLPYLRAEAGYTLRILGNKGFSDPNKFIRHRPYFGLNGSYKMRYAKIYLRERFLCDIRTDSINAAEKNAANWILRSRLGADFYILSRQDVKPYVWAELENTLNAPEYQQQDGRQYISHIRAQAGVNWRITRLSSLEFYYRFQYGYNRDINITKTKGYIQLTEETSFLHAFGITYHLGW